MHYHTLRRLAIPVILLFGAFPVFAQNSIKQKSNKSIYTGIEVGSKGVKMSVIEIGKNAQTSGAFTILKDTSVNTDFITFSDSTFQATLHGLCGLYNTALNEYKLSSKRIFTVVSSGVKSQAEKDSKQDWITNLIDSFRLKIDEPRRKVEIVDVTKESMLSHLGIVPAARRYSTFLIDIGSGNTKGGFFPYGNTTDFKHFQLSWGTKSTANATEKMCGDDKTITNFNKQLYRVLAGAENSEIIYAVNSSGAYPVSDNIAVSGGIAWAAATLMFPELLDNSVIPITYAELEKFNEKLSGNFGVLSPAYLTRLITNTEEKQPILKELKRIHQVFDQKSLMSGTGLLLKIMRQFESAFAGKQFFLVKNGQVGWVSAYVDQNVD
ncbi:MAG: hypothetical protein H7Y01_15180 [Ferruginibacter sp.]|nr:hypothetical protein [Chitinophagaceae bacterium]